MKPIRHERIGHCCLCTNHKFYMDVGNNVCITIDGIIFAFKENIGKSGMVIQFPYSYSEWESNHTTKFSCKTCHNIPYDIVRLSDVSKNR